MKSAPIQLGQEKIMKDSVQSPFLAALLFVNVVKRFSAKSVMENKQFSVLSVSMWLKLFSHCL